MIMNVPSIMIMSWLICFMSFSINVEWWLWLYLPRAFKNSFNLISILYSRINSHCILYVLVFDLGVDHSPLVGWMQMFLLYLVKKGHPHYGVMDLYNVSWFSLLSQFITYLWNNLYESLVCFGYFQSGFNTFVVISNHSKHVCVESHYVLINTYKRNAKLL